MDSNPPPSPFGVRLIARQVIVWTPIPAAHCGEEKTFLSSQCSASSSRWPVTVPRAALILLKSEVSGAANQNNVTLEKKGKMTPVRRF